ncbi:hypothetical protein NM688_g5238 [Phlebia brevispora]|uniref:Uncharacterized protein n=1 Tax=Phlebia brevispora TaxID=194682 RepID=A0ACC1SYG3_9APHY|nr:hypothetical protein NM688_g5238 [Phlebia brevispora]
MPRISRSRSYNPPVVTRNSPAKTRSAAHRLYITIPSVDSENKYLQHEKSSTSGPISDPTSPQYWQLPANSPLTAPSLSPVPLHDGTNSSSIIEHPRSMYIPGEPTAASADETEYTIPQTTWPSEEPGTSSDSYVPHTPIPIRIRKNRGDSPSRRSMRASMTTSKPQTTRWRRSTIQAVNVTAAPMTDYHKSNPPANPSVQHMPPLEEQLVPRPLRAGRDCADPDLEKVYHCFYQNCQDVMKPGQSAYRSLVRHLDKHFPHRFMCPECGIVLSRALSSSKHKSKHPGVRVDDVVLREPYWSDPEYASDLRRPADNNAIFFPPKPQKSKKPQEYKPSPDLSWLKELPWEWQGNEESLAVD